VAHWRNRPRFWTIQKIEQLRRSYRDGVHVDDIAAEFGVSRIAIWSKARDLRLERGASKRLKRSRKDVAPNFPSKPWTDDDIIRLRDYYAAGLHVLAICNLMQRSKGAVVGKAHRLELMHPNAGLPVNYNYGTKKLKARWR